MRKLVGERYWLGLSEIDAKSYFVILLTSPLLAQSPQFEVASVKPFAPAPGQVAAGLHFDGALAVVSGYRSGTVF